MHLLQAACLALTTTSVLMTDQFGPVHPLETDFLTYSDIDPDLLSKTNANGWNTNIPPYILGLSRGNGGGVAGVGIGFAEQLGRSVVTQANECGLIEWIMHDGASFGRQAIGSESAVALVDWLYDSHTDVVSVRATGELSGIAFVFLEGMSDVTEHTFDDGRKGILFTDLSGGRFLLTPNVESYSGLVTVPEGSTSRWVAPSNIFRRLMDTEATREKGIYTPNVPRGLGSLTQPMSMMFFDSKLFAGTEFSYTISPLNYEGNVQFDSAVFESKKTAFSSAYSSDYAMKSMANLLGNLGRFHGDVDVKDPDALVNVFDTKLSMTSSGPARTRFPRPFLWDDGFHILAIERFNKHIAIEMVTSWLRTQRVSIEAGWIPRENALSLRDRSLIPPEYTAQSPIIANPPTMVFVIRKWIREGNVIPAGALLKIGRHLVRWYEHLERSQNSDFGDKKTCFRWKSRDYKHCLSSGLDDYPRGGKVFPTECHLDLHAWMMLLADTIREIQGIVPALSERSWPTVTQNLSGSLRTVFKPYGSDILADRQDCEETSFLGLRPSYLGLPSGISSCDISNRCPENTACNGIHAPYRGYINIIPLALGRLDPVKDIRIIEGTVTELLNPSILLSDYGLRSLSASDPSFRTADDYWRGNIWANINLITAGALAAYAKAISGNAKYNDLANRMTGWANKLKTDWVRAMQRAWDQSGGPREYLTPLTGLGGGVYPFAGWTAASMCLLDTQEATWADFWTDAIGIIN